MDVVVSTHSHRGEILYADYLIERQNKLRALADAATIAALTQLNQGDRGNMNAARIAALVNSHQSTATSRGRIGQAFHAADFNDLGPCAKCQIIHQFTNLIPVSGPAQTNCYPDLACAEDL